MYALPFHRMTINSNDTFRMMLLALVTFFPQTSARTMTVVNACPFTIWYVYLRSARKVSRRIHLLVTSIPHRPAVSRSRKGLFIALYRSLCPDVHRSQCGDCCAELSNWVSVNDVLKSLHQHGSRWEAQPSTSVSFTIPDNWTSGRIWVRVRRDALVHAEMHYCVAYLNTLSQGRRDCNFANTTGPTCLTGWCNGGLECDPHTGTVRHVPYKPSPPVEYKY